MARGPLSIFFRLQAASLTIVGPVAAAASWLACSRLALVAARNEIDVAKLGEPARSVLANPGLALVPGAAILAFALLALLVRKGRGLLLVLAILSLLAALALMMATAMQVIGPMYEYKEL
ncbi:MAG: hypothetical protein U0575_16500 [Phycisphaerales bacterium]